MFGQLTWFKLYLYSGITLNLLDHLPITANHNSYRMAWHSYLQNYKNKTKTINYYNSSKAVENF